MFAATLSIYSVQVLAQCPFTMLFLWHRGGRLFFIFIAFLQFGLEAMPGAEKGENYNWLGIFTGCFLIFEGLLVIFLQCMYPHLMKEKKPEVLARLPPVPMEAPVNVPVLPAV